MSDRPAPEGAGLAPDETVRRILANVETVIEGQRAPLRVVIAVLAAGGHCLLEDFPGTGKTTLAKALAISVGLEFKRVQFTPDLLPSDIIGVSIFDQHEQRFQFRPGPIFCEVLLADEINRASPRTQSALLEAMAEGQVTAEGRSYALADPFFVIATQNPVEFHGTYPLPEAQMDRFAVRLSLGYVSLEQELAVVAAQGRGHPLDGLEPCVAREDLLALKRAVAEVEVAEELRRYAVEVVRATREARSVQMGAGPRASLALIRTAQALALLDGEDFVAPEHLRELLVPVIAHRLALDPKARFSGLTGAQVVEEIAERVQLPA